MSKFTNEEFQAAVERALNTNSNRLDIVGKEYFGPGVNFTVRSRSGKSTHTVSYHVDENGKVWASRGLPGEAGITILGDEIIKQLWAL